MSIAELIFDFTEQAFTRGGDQPELRGEDGKARINNLLPQSVFTGSVIYARKTEGRTSKLCKLHETLWTFPIFLDSLNIKSCITKE